MLIHSREQRPSKLHRAGLEMEGLYAGFQGDDSDAVTIATVATIYCPSPLDRKARGGCGLMEKETRRLGFKSR